MGHSRLVGVRAKLDRAGEHIEELNATAEAWFENCAPPQFITEVDGEWEVVRIGIPELPPPSIPVIAGDVVHNLRSALDHLAWQLVDSICGKPNGDNYFPICMDQGDFKARVWTPRKDKRGRIRGPLVGIPLSYPSLKVVESHQPYLRWNPNQGMNPEDDPLAFLNAMWNIDKHRTLHTTFIETGDTPQEVLELFEWEPDFSLIEQHVNTKVLGFWLEDGDELARFRFEVTTRPQPYVRPKGHVPAHIKIGYVKGRPPTSIRMGLRGWNRINDRLEEIITDLERFF